MIRLLKFVVWSGFAVVCGLALSLSGAFLYINPTLPSVEALRSIQLQIPLRIYSSDGKLIAEYGEMRRTPIEFEAIPAISSTPCWLRRTTILRIIMALTSAA